MENFRSIMISPDMTAIEAMSVIDKGGKGTVFICEGEVLSATLTDGDIRRHILRGGDLNAPVSQIGNKNFKYARQGYGCEHMGRLRRKWGFYCIPILDGDGRIVDISLPLASKEPKRRLNIPVVIMAGGKGTRLHPYTKVLPKPLIPIGDLTITEHILQSFIDYGCTDFTMILNHKKNMIKAFFADDGGIEGQMTFLDEDKPLGTGGGLSLLRGRMRETFFMTNCDILIFEDYAKILESHRADGNLMTMVCTTKQFTIPYGAVEIDGKGQITAITEKPSYSILANTGFYVIEPDFIESIPEGTVVDMTDLVLACVNRGEKVCIYPVSEDQWADMGQLEEMEKMRERLGE